MDTEVGRTRRDQSGEGRVGDRSAASSETATSRGALSPGPRRERLQQREQANAVLVERLQQLERRNTQLEQTNTALLRRLEALEQRCEGLVARCQRLETENARLREELRQRDEEIARLRHENAALRKEIARLSKKLERTEKENRRLKEENERLRARLEEARRAGKRQAAPFAKPPKRGSRKKPGRKPGPAYGRQACLPPPSSDQIDERYAVPLPSCCPHCGGRRIERTGEQVQYQQELPEVRPIWREFRIQRGRCSDCGRTVRGRHRLQTSDAVGAASVQLGPRAHATL
ncbi:MAG: hypothetical protein GXP27_22435, partial [Planctomycetes bacterium]|nr:hypothetical protein [Planctomycetota bacterium]